MKTQENKIIKEFLASHNEKIKCCDNFFSFLKERNSTIDDFKDAINTSSDELKFKIFTELFYKAAYNDKDFGFIIFDSLDFNKLNEKNINLSSLIDVYLKFGEYKIIETILSHKKGLKFFNLQRVNTNKTPYTKKFYSPTDVINLLEFSVLEKDKRLFDIVVNSYKKHQKMKLGNKNNQNENILMVSIKNDFSYATDYFLNEISKTDKYDYLLRQKDNNSNYLLDFAIAFSKENLLQLYFEKLNFKKNHKDRKILNFAIKKIIIDYYNRALNYNLIENKIAAKFIEALIEKPIKINFYLKEILKISIQNNNEDLFFYLHSKKNINIENYYSYENLGLLLKSKAKLNLFKTCFETILKKEIYSIEQINSDDNLINFIERINLHPQEGYEILNYLKDKGIEFQKNETTKKANLDPLYQEWQSMITQKQSLISIITEETIKEKKTKLRF